ncbi:hypothetical protein GCM10010219_59350 [Streptomyces netropsis]|nr:hypothetical protein GCM10010219_59350 [Streptomyces netropsis]
MSARRHGGGWDIVARPDRGSVSVDTIYTDMAKPREAALRGTAADLRWDGLDMTQGTRTLCQTHNKAPASVAATRSSLRSAGAFSALPRQAGRGYTSPRMGVAMT